MVACSSQIGLVRLLSSSAWLGLAWPARLTPPPPKQRVGKLRNDSYHIFFPLHVRGEHGTNHGEAFSQQREAVQIVAKFSVAKSKAKSKRNRSKT